MSSLGKGMRREKQSHPATLEREETLQKQATGLSLERVVGTSAVLAERSVASAEAVAIVVEAAAEQILTCLQGQPHVVREWAPTVPHRLLQSLYSELLVPPVAAH